MYFYSFFANPETVPRNALLSLAIILVLGVGAQWLAWRLRLPSILLLLATGFLAGPVFDVIQPDRLMGWLLRPTVSLFVAFILFEGGLTLNLAEIRGSGAVVRNLVTVGAAVTFLVSTVAAYLFLGFEIPLAMLLSAILIVTGPTVIMPMLRHVRPTGPSGPILRWEGIVIDPIGATLALLAFEVLVATERGGLFAHTSLALINTLVVGTGMGCVAAWGLAQAIRRYWLPDFLQNATALALVALVFSLSNQMQEESGLLSVTVMGIFLANQRMAPVDHILEFKENLRVLFIAVLFIVLTARLQPADIAQLPWGTAVFIAIIILVARPLAVLVSTAGSELDWRSRAFLMCMAPRGIVAAAVASFFGFELARLGFADGTSLTAVTFLTIASTVAVYGIAARPIAHRLGVAVANPQGLLIVGANPFARAIAEAVKAAGIRVLLVDTNRENVTAARMAGLPVYRGSIVGERGLENINLGGLGRLLAMTPNDEVNVLAAQRFVRIFGRESVFQLAPKRDPGGKTQIDKQLQGRWLFDENADFRHLNERMLKEAVIKTTKLSADFGFDSFVAHHGPSALVLFRMDAKGRLTVHAAGTTIKPGTGDTIVALVDRPSREERRELATAIRPAT